MAESLFTYGPGEDVDTFSVPHHIPPFLDALGPVDPALITACHGFAECVFDSIHTGDLSVGLATFETNAANVLTAQTVGKNSSQSA